MPDIDPRVFGPSMWKTLHHVALGFPDEPTEKHKQAYAIWFHNLSNVIPCQSCAEHYEELISENPPDEHMTDSHALFRWVVAIHNRVNDRLGKPRYTEDDALREATEKQYLTIKQRHMFALGVSIIAIITILLIYKCAY